MLTLNLSDLAEMIDSSEGDSPVEVDVTSKVPELSEAKFHHDNARSSVHHAARAPCDLDDSESPTREHVSVKHGDSHTDGLKTSEVSEVQG